MTAPSPAGLSPLLDQLDEARAAATPGPWVEDGRAILQPEGYEVYPVVAEDYGVCRIADAALIVAAVNALPRLVAAVRAVEELVDDWKRYRVLPPDLADRLRSALTAALTEGTTP